MQHVEAALSPRFPSKRDAWLAALIWGGAIVAVVGGAVASQAIPQPEYAALALGASAASGAFMLWVLYGTHYVVGPTQLHIYGGPVRVHVPLAGIESITPTRNPQSSPACSLDRLLIVYGPQRKVMISPEDKTGFMHAIVSRAPQLVLEADRARRRDG